MLILKPLITEQTLLEAKLGRFSFVVDKGARKEAIRGAVEKQFGVTVTKIETTSTPGKTYRAGKSRMEKKKVVGKKAKVTLGKDQKIDLFEMGGTE